MELLTSNTKLGKAVPGWHILGLQLLPGDSAGYGELCPNRGECFKVCIAWAGRGTFKGVREARQRRTALLFENPTYFASLLDFELLRATSCAMIAGCKLAIRLNVFSDIDWRGHPEVYRVLLRHRKGGVVFYDYTKKPGKPDSKLYGDPARVCFSWSERAEVVPRWASWVSIVVPSFQHTVARPVADWHGSIGGSARMSDGDRDDLFFLRAPGIQGLLSKGLARREGSATGFVMGKLGAL